MPVLSQSPADLPLPSKVEATAAEEGRENPTGEARDGEEVSSENTGAGDGADDENQEAPSRFSQGIGGNPAAVNIMMGTGALGRLLGLEQSGVRLGGLWVGDTNWLMSGGVQPGSWTSNSLTVLDLSLDTQKLAGVPGGLFDVQFLQFSGQPTNDDAGVVQGYNGQVGQPPLVRQELYRLWCRQELFDGKLIVRAGKLVPTYDFNNVTRPIPLDDPNEFIPAVSGLIYTPIFVNPTMLGKMPGYYNSATGIITTLAPIKSAYFSYGVYDGNRATGEQTGLQGPRFNGYYFHIWEGGHAWRLGAQRKPGMLAAGFWYQTGNLTAANGAQVNGADGVYLFGSQRLWYLRPGQDASGVTSFFQFGANNSNTMMVRQYLGLGLTSFGLTPGRPKDSMGCGMAWSWLNTDPNAGAFFFPGVPFPGTAMRNNELMLASYYQMNLFTGAFFQPTLTYVPNPGERPGIPAVWAITAQLVFLF
jgi:porin